jgi:streptomycin 6-kinase
MNLELHPAFVSTIRSTFGARGDAWLSRLPTLLDEFKHRWHLTLLPPFPDLSFNYVIPGLRDDGSEAVLKLGVPTDELTSEVEALKAFGGRGAVCLLEADPQEGALLLERLLPGKMLTTVAEDEDATRSAADALRPLWGSDPQTFPFKTTADWARGLEKLPTLFPNGTPIPARWIDQARALFHDLIPTQTSSLLLHGDFQHTNILSTGDGWRVIDPKGIVGEAEFELAAFLENKIDVQDASSTRKITEKRIAIFCEVLGFDRKRVRDWLIAHSILSTWWLVEDHGVEYGEIEPALTMTGIFQTIKI